MAPFDVKSRFYTAVAGLARMSIIKVVADDPFGVSR